MKSLYIMRHAKAIPHNTAPTDFQRQLTEGGLNDANEMGIRLYEKKPHLQVIISSPAKRTKETAETVAKALQMDACKIIYDEDIYESSPHNLARIVSEISDKYNSVMLVGHNPAFTYMMEYFCNKQIDNLPTSGMFLVEFETNTWKEATKHNGNLKWADWPKL
ncbi:MAG: histidine phosphatase family protein [Bacteroidota bacterium]|nr:histidine phosphatase family protein [Bacteroidota bacterium]